MIPVSVYVHWRKRVRIHARAARANVRTILHIKHWRPNGWTDCDPNWYKDALGQSAQVMGVGVRVARAARAQHAIRTVRPCRASAKRENERKST
jgi:hypothetical protein